MLRNRLLLLAAVAMLPMVLAGCVAKSVSDAGVRFHYQWWLPIGLFAAGLVCLCIGLFVRRYSSRIGWPLIIGGPIALAFAPSLFLERVFVEDRGFDVHSGILGMTANQSVEFNSVKSLRIAQEETGGRRSRWIEVLYFDMKDGSEARLPLNNDVKIEAAREILLRASKRGIPLTGLK